MNDVVLVVLVGGLLLLLISAQSNLSKLRKYETDHPMSNRDIQQMRDTLDLLQRRFEALATMSFDAVLMADADGRIVTINSEAQRVFKVGPEAVGKTLMTVTRHHELDGLASTLLAGEENLEIQITIENRVFRVRGALVRMPQHSSVVIILQDVTELLRLSRARRDMVANLSHDLRTPISSIRLLVEGLMLNIGKNPERDQRNLGKIASMVDNLQHMTQELMDLSMIESGQAIMRMVRVDFAEVLQNALRLMESQIEQKHIEVVNEVPRSNFVLADADQIKRVLTNLVHNAIKFTPNDGQIQFDARADGNMLTVCVKDTGPGIPPHERQRVFERFYQVDSPRTAPGEKSSGTGLGLAIAKHIIEAHGGTIWAEAGVPSGARICFTLPLEKMPAVSDPSNHAS